MKSNEKVIVITPKKIKIAITILIILLIAALIAFWLIAGKKTTDTSKNSATASSSKSNSSFTLTSEAGLDGGTLPIEYTCDGASVTPALAWSNVPAGTKEFALMITTVPVDGSTKYSWVLYNIPGSLTSLAKNGSSVGKLGVGSHFATTTYQPPCSKGPGLNKYTYTLYALSTSPVLPIDQTQVNGEVLTKAISSITIDSASLSLNYQRAQ